MAESPQRRPFFASEREKCIDDIPLWDQDFLKDHHDTLYDLMVAAHGLNIKGLLLNCCKTVAEMIKENKVDEVRNLYFNFTPLAFLLHHWRLMD